MKYLNLHKLISFIVVMSALTLLSCGNTKTVTEYVEVVKIDTITKTVVKTIEKPVIDTLIVESPCDSLGILKPFKRRIKTNSVDVTLFNKDGAIAVKVDIDSIVNVKIEEARKSFKKDIQIKETIKRIPNKLNYYSIIANIILIALLFRKKISFLKWIPF